MDHEETCGQELAGSALVPERFGALFKHVALNLREHAVWVGTASPDAQREHDALLSVARAYEAISQEAQRTADLMRTLHDLPATAHDPGKWDHEKFTEWMKTKVQMQRALVALLLEHAEQSQSVLDQMAGDRVKA